MIASDDPVRAINKKVSEIKDRIKELEDLKKEVKEKCCIAKTDKDCKLMLMNNGGFNPAYYEVSFRIIFKQALIL